MVLVRSSSRLVWVFVPVFDFVLVSNLVSPASCRRPSHYHSQAGCGGLRSLPFRLLHDGGKGREGDLGIAPSIS